MRLQGFGDHYQVKGKHGGHPTRTEAMTMIGDAVPPKAMAPYFARVKEALRVTDEEVANYKPEVISLDD
jgi:site-specific DNA-cytosine methylase